MIAQRIPTERLRIRTGEQPSLVTVLSTAAGPVGRLLSGLPSRLALHTIVLGVSVAAAAAALAS